MGGFFVEKSWGIFVVGGDFRRYPTRRPTVLGGLEDRNCDRDTPSKAYLSVITRCVAGDDIRPGRRKSCVSCSVRGKTRHARCIVCLVGAEPSHVSGHWRCVQPLLR